MADGPQPLSRPLAIAGWFSAGLVVLLVAGTVVAVGYRAEGGEGLRPSDWAAVRFTLWQAALSSALSVLLAIPVARALARRRFRGRAAIVTLLGAPFILPVIVAVLGLLMVFGRGGLLNAALASLGLPTITIYGAPGVILAHVFFNLPLATRLILQGWATIPAERFRLAANLGLSPRVAFRLIEVPMLRAVVPGAALVIFLICTTSFAVALTLGGGPRATTMELAIYEAFRFDFDLGRAARLALLQLAVTAIAGVLTLAVAIPDALGSGLDRTVKRWEPGTRSLDVVVIALATCFLVLPLAALAIRGAGAVPSLPVSVWAAAGRSLAVAAGSAVLTLLIALPLAIAVVRSGPAAGRLLEISGLLGIAASPLVIGTGLFIVTFPFVSPATLALPVTALVNAVMAMPFALRVLIPGVAKIETDYGRLASSLGLHGWALLRILVLPRLRRALGFGGGLAAALSMGDLGVVALFADSGTTTLPLQLYRLMGAYRMDEAAGAALLLLTLSLLVFWVCDHGGRMDADA